VLHTIIQGGYCLKSLAEGAALTIKALLGDPCPMIQPIKKVDDRYALVGYSLNLFRFTNRHVVYLALQD